MKAVFALEPLPKSIFLAGPTPRDEATPSWRPEALKLLEGMGFDGSVYVPENKGWGISEYNYDTQTRWEWEAIAVSTVVVFWVPRELKSMPAFTTNVEFGLTIASGKCLLGYPEGAPKMRYLHHLATRYNAPVFHTLPDILKAAVDKTCAPYVQT